MIFYTRTTFVHYFSGFQRTIPMLFPALRSMQIFCVPRILFPLVLSENSTYFKHIRSMQKKLLVRYHFPQKVRSQRQIFLHRPTRRHFSCGNTLNPRKMDSRETFFLHRPKESLIYKPIAISRLFHSSSEQ